MRGTGIAIAAILCVWGRPAHGASPFSRRGSNISLRKRLHINTLIAEPGTGEVDWSGLYSFDTGFTVPSGFRYTPAGPYVFWGRTEYAVFTDFNQSATVAATAVLLDGDKFDLAIQPQASWLFHSESGERFGATAIARYDTGKSSIGATASWAYATNVSPTNPAGVWDLGVGMGRRLAAEGFLGRLTPHVNSVWERATGASWSLSLFEGVELQITGRLGFDVSGQHISVRGDSPEHQLAFGFTYSLGKLQ
jgi:hypothetical protein